MTSSSGAEPKALKARRGSGQDVIRASASYVAQVNAKGPQAVFKVVSHSRGCRVAAVLNYVERADKSLDKQLEAENQDGMVFKGPEDMREIYEEWKQDFERATPKPRERKTDQPEVAKKERHHEPRRIPPPIRRNRLHHLSELAVVRERSGAELLLQGNVPGRLASARSSAEMRGPADRARLDKSDRRLPRHATHAILSADCENTPANARKVMAAARDIMQEQLGSEGYQYVMVLHQDTKNPHVHVVINNYNRDPEKQKLKLNPPELFVIRSRFAERMTELGLEQHATRRLDRPEVLERIQNGIEALKKSGKWYEQKLFRASLANTATPGKDAEKSAAPATPKMLKFAERLAEKNGAPLPGNDFDTVRAYLAQHGKAGEVEKPIAFDAFAKRQAMAKAIAKLKDQVKDTTLPFSAERKERMQALREISQELIKPDAPDFRRLVDQLAVKLRNEGEKVRDQLKALQDPQPGEPKRETYRRQLERRRAVEKIVERNIANIEKQRKAINADPRIPNDTRRNVLELLRTHQQNLNKVVSQDKGRDR